MCIYSKFDKLYAYTLRFLEPCTVIFIKMCCFCFKYQSDWKTLNVTHNVAMEIKINHNNSNNNNNNNNNNIQCGNSIQSTQQISVPSYNLKIQQINSQSNDVIFNTNSINNPATPTSKSLSPVVYSNHISD